jgi:hypothetical protein
MRFLASQKSPFAKPAQGMAPCHALLRNRLFCKRVQNRFAGPVFLIGPFF